MPRRGKAQGGALSWAHLQSWGNAGAGCRPPAFGALGSLITDLITPQRCRLCDDSPNVLHIDDIEPDADLQKQNSGTSRTTRVIRASPRRHLARSMCTDGIVHT